MGTLDEISYINKIVNGYLSKTNEVNKKKIIINILIGLLLIGLSYWVRSRDYALGFTGMVFSVPFTLHYIIKFFRPNFSWIRNADNYKKPSPEAIENFKKVYDDTGIFKFHDAGFSIKIDGELQVIQWTEIKSMIGYKEDYVTTDSVCLDVFCDGDRSFKIIEETAGWFQFLEHSKVAIPSINKSWEFEITVPAFEANTTVVYDRNNRKLKDVLAEFYKK